MAVGDGAPHRSRRDAQNTLADRADDLRPPYRSAPQRHDGGRESTPPLEGRGSQGVQGGSRGRWWTVGDVHNTPGRSMFVRLRACDRGAAGKWTDAATGEHGDLHDLIATAEGCTTLAGTLDEARRFLSLPRDEPREPIRPVAQGSPEAARRLFAMSKPIRGTVAEAYLRTRGITDLRNCRALRFHPRCYYRGEEGDAADAVRNAWPALIAATTDLAGLIIGVHRITPPGGPDCMKVHTRGRADKLTWSAASAVTRPILPSP